RRGPRIRLLIRDSGDGQSRCPNLDAQPLQRVLRIHLAYARTRQRRVSTMLFAARRTRRRATGARARAARPETRVRARWLGPMSWLVLRRRQPWLAGRRAWHGLRRGRARAKSR